MKPTPSVGTDTRPKASSEQVLPSGVIELVYDVRD
jgi:hypothetical protein